MTIIVQLNYNLENDSYSKEVQIDVQNENMDITQYLIMLYPKINFAWYIQDWLKQSFYKSLIKLRLFLCPYVVQNLYLLLYNSINLVR